MGFGVRLIHPPCRAQGLSDVEAHLLLHFSFLLLEISLVGCCTDPSVFLVFLSRILSHLSVLLSGIVPQFSN